MTDESNWFEWDAKEKRYSFRKTEDHIFSPAHWDKRIGDMTRDELIHVIAMCYQEREDLAKAFVRMADAAGIATADHLEHARRIVERAEKDSRGD